MIDFKAGLDGETVPGQTIQAYDRDPAGVLINSWQNGTSQFSPLDPQDGSSPSFSPNSVCQYVRPDGFTIGDIHINGVRAFDPALQTWTTPDAFEGDIHDPASQQKYMWNRGNPVDYSDPSGYDPYIIVDMNAALGNGHLSIAIIDPKTGVGTWYSQGPPNGEFGGVRQVATAQRITLRDIAKLASDGRVILSEHTTAAQDKAMNARGQALARSDHKYNAITCNCDQFVKDILSASDSQAAGNMSLIPRTDAVKLIQEGARSGHPGTAPNGFKTVNGETSGKQGW